MAEDKLALQLSSGEVIANFKRNTAKIGTDNLSVDVLSNSLNLLDTYWKSCVEVHLSLSLYIEFKTGEIFHP